MMLRVPLPSIRTCGLPALLALITWVAVLSSLDAAGDYPGWGEGPGLTVDEVFNVQEGVRLVDALEPWAVGAISLRQAWGEPQDLAARSEIGYHNPDHPPLGRFCIGLFHNITVSLFPPKLHDANQPFVTSAARTAPATAFALTVFLIGVFATKWYGPFAGCVAAVSLVLMPRLFGHAHLAALETFEGLTYAASVLSIAHWWEGESPPSWKTSTATGFVFGLALLTKIQAVLLPLPVALWAIWRWRTKALVPLGVWGNAGFLLFFAGWPWLWIDPVGHLGEYFGRTTQRAAIYVWYFGSKIADHDVPWHYPAIMFVATVPIGLQLLAILGLRRNHPEGNVRQESWRECLLLAGIVFPLAVFAIPGVPVYDGTRLFLVVFPLWGVFAGRGGATALKWLERKLNRRASLAILCGFLLLQASGVISLRPCYLSYYNLAVGGLCGAERMGLEPTYWGDSVTRSFLYDVVAAVPREAVVEVTPRLHQFQLDEMRIQSPILRNHGVQLVPFRTAPAGRTRYVLMFRRKADLPPQLWEVSADARELAGVRRQGVPLAALYEFPADFVKSSSAAKPQQKAPLVLTLRNSLVPTLRVGMQRPDAPRPLRDPERRKHSFPRRAWERGYEDNRACDLSKVTNARRPHQGACCPPEVRL